MGSTGSSGITGSLIVSEEELEALAGSEYSLDELDASGGSEFSVEYSMLSGMFSGSEISDVLALMVSVEALEELDVLSPAPLLEGVVLEELLDELETVE